MFKNILARYPKKIYKFGNILNRKVTLVTFKKSSIRFHSVPQSVEFQDMIVKILPALQDNYMYLIIDESTSKAVVVDPVEPDIVIEAVRQEKLSLSAALTTHHHWDHAGGNRKLLSMLPNIEIFGGDKRIEGLTTLVKHNDVITVGNLTFKCIFTPCHTKGHICYYAEMSDKPSAVFTGDTLFSAGCGRFFEGTAEEMYVALVEKLGKLPDDTKVFCGHEYTLSNLKFAVAVDPENEEIHKKLKWAEEQRKNNVPTIPSTIGEEKQINPFMRVHNDGIKSFTGKKDPIMSMKTLREKKDNFKSSRLKKRKVAK